MFHRWLADDTMRGDQALAEVVALDVAAEEVAVVVEVVDAEVSTSLDDLAAYASTSAILHCETDDGWAGGGS